MRSRTILATAACSMLLVGGSAAQAADAISADPPARPERPSRLMTIGRAYTTEAGGCESRNTHFHVTAIQPIDRTKMDKSQVLAGVFFRSQQLTGQSGWRNVGFSPDGRSIEFDLYARGGGELDSAGSGRSRCEAPSPARAVVDIEAWVFD